MSQTTLIHRALEQGQGVLRLAPNWVPRSFCIPGRRIKLHPDDKPYLRGLFAGSQRGAYSSAAKLSDGVTTGGRV